MKMSFFSYLLLAVALVVALRAKADPLSFRDQWVSQGVPARALDLALAFDDSHREITNKQWLVIADYTQADSAQRLFVLNLENGALIKTYVSHGEGSDDGSGLSAVRFSNTNDSLMTSPGFIRIGKPIQSPGYGPAFRLDGLEPRNDLVAKRKIIMHSADYTSSEFIKTYGHPGLSQGCPAIPPEVLSYLFTQKISGSLFYAYTPADAE
jgi:hypothetical protein